MLCVKKLSYYLDNSNIALWSDYLLQRMFLEKNTLKRKVNNWAVEISPFKTKYEYIEGIKILWLINRLIKIDPDIQLGPEARGHEQCYYVFDSLANISMVP